MASFCFGHTLPNALANLTRITKKLYLAQQTFLTAADQISPQQWQIGPGKDRWSAAEIVAHLCQVERTILGSADRIIRHIPRPIPFLKRFHFPLLMVEARLVRRKSPIPLDPGLLGEKESMLADLRNLRERTFAFLQETSARNLRPYYWPHAFLGMLNTYEWFEMIAAHQLRHAKQIKGLAAEIPKVVVNSWK